MATQVDVLANFIDGELLSLGRARRKRFSTRPPARSWRARRSPPPRTSTAR